MVADLLVDGVGAAKTPALSPTVLVDGRGPTGVVRGAGVGLPLGRVGRAKADSVGASTVKKKAEPSRPKDRRLRWAIETNNYEILRHCSRLWQIRDGMFLFRHKTVLEIVPPAHAQDTDRAPWCIGKHICCY